MESFSNRSICGRLEIIVKLISFIEKFNYVTFFCVKNCSVVKKFGKKIMKQIKKLFVFFFDETGFQYVKY